MVGNRKKTSSVEIPNGTCRQPNGGCPLRVWVLAAVFLVAVTLAVYLRVYHFDFVNYDDNVYVTANRHISDGLTWPNVEWALTHNYAANWHPLTWMSHMLDLSLFGSWAGGHHLTNLVFHLANTLLLLAFLGYTTGRLWASLFVAAMFALHPLHVESVAWVAERKDVLSTFFWMLTMLAYLRYVKAPGWRTYLPVAIAFSLGLMSKPMVVTLPIVLLLLDYWPLKRFTLDGWQVRAEGLPVRRLVLEKVPLFVMSCAGSVMTVIAQRQGMPSTDVLDIPSRITNAVISCGRYAFEMVWPANLAALYLHPGKALYGQAAVVLVLLAVATVAVFVLGRRHKYVLVGWLWYLVTLVPVLGIVQVGIQSHADRYTYIPLVGLFIVVAWTADEYVTRRPRAGWFLAMAAVVAIGPMACMTWRTAGYWRNDVTLCTRALSVTDGNYRMMTNLGIYLLNNGEIERGQALLEKSHAIRPNEVSTLNGLGTAFALKGSYAEAAECFRTVTKLAPNMEEPVVNLGLALEAMGRYDEAVVCYREALVKVPGWPLAYNHLGEALGSAGRLDEGIAALRTAIALVPDFAEARFNLGNLYFQKRDLTAAVSEYEKAVPTLRDYRAFNNLGVSLTLLNRFDEAEKVYRNAISLGIGGGAPHAALAGMLDRRGLKSEAKAEFEVAMRLDPGNPAFEAAYKDLTGVAR